MKKFYSSILLILIICGQLYSQTSNKTLSKHANELYNLGRYKDALSVYKDLIRQKKQLTTEEKRSIYYCATLNNDFETALIVAENENQKNLALLSLGQYNSISGNSPQWKLYSNPNYYIDLIKDSSFVVSYTKEWFNSGSGDYNYFQINEKPYFTSNRNYPSIINNRWEGNNTFISNIYLLNENKQIKKANKKLPLHQGAGTYSPKYDLYIFTKNIKNKQSASDPFKLGIFIKDNKTNKVTPFPYNSTLYSTGHPFMINDTLYFVSDSQEGRGGTDIYISIYNPENQSWSDPINQYLINTEFNEMFPFVYGTSLFYSSNAPGSLGGLDIFKADIINGEARFPKNIGAPINTRFDDFSYYQINETCYFSSNRENYIDNIYSAKIANLEFKLNLKTTIALNNKLVKPLGNMDIIILSQDNKPIKTQTDSTGLLTLKLDRNQLIKIIPITTKEYSPLKDDTIVLNTKIKFSKTYKEEITYKPNFIDFKALVLEDKTNKTLDNVRLFIIDKDSSKNKQILYSSETGFVEAKLKTNTNYQIQVSKKGYLDAEIEYATKDFNINDTINLAILLSKLEVGTKFEIKNILYDYNQAKLRDESKIELDKLVDFLMTNDNITVELSSHTDSRGSDSYNMSLSQRRAQSCVDYLISKGINKSKIIAKGYGESQPLNKCTNGIKCSEDEHQINRRTELKILKFNQ